MIYTVPCYQYNLITRKKKHIYFSNFCDIDYLKKEQSRVIIFTGACWLRTYLMFWVPFLRAVGVTSEIPLRNT